MPVFEFVMATRTTQRQRVEADRESKGGRRFMPANHALMRQERPVTPLMAALNDWKHGGKRSGMLLKAHADPNARGVNLTPLMLCAASGNHEPRERTREEGVRRRHR